MVDGGLMLVAIGVFHLITLALRVVFIGFGGFVALLRMVATSAIACFVSSPMCNVGKFVLGLVSRSCRISAVACLR